MVDYGFIISRHVNSETTNKYWNQCVKLIRSLYPFRKIVIIDDNSNYEFVKSEHDYQNLTIIQSEYPGRGELLPYYYYLKYKWFESAVIIHDSLFIHAKIDFSIFKMPVLPLWHHAYDKENLHNINRIASSLKNNNNLIRRLNNNDEQVIGFISNAKNINLCFGCQCFIRLDFLQMLENKYKITNMVKTVHNRPDRCALERIFGALFCQECPTLFHIKSMFGDIMRQPRTFNYTYEDYDRDIKTRRKLKKPFIKVWTGR